MKRLLALSILAATVCLPQAAQADTRKLTIKNNTDLMIVGVVVRGGEIQGGTRIWSGQSRTFDIVVPNGKCVVTLRASFGGDRYTNIDETLNLCKYGRLNIGVAD